MLEYYLSISLNKAVPYWCTHAVKT